jgi:hypothetical protein
MCAIEYYKANDKGETVASEKYYEVMNTDFEVEAAKSMNNIFDFYNQTIDLVNSDQADKFKLFQQLKLIRWTETAMSDNLEDFKLLHEARVERKRKKEEKQISEGIRSNPS